MGVVEIEGYLNNLGGEKISDACNALMDEGMHRFVFGMERCSMINSVGISFLIEVLEKVQGLGGGLAFCGVSPTVSKTLQIMGLLQTATLHDTEEEALQALIESR